MDRDNYWTRRAEEQEKYWYKKSQMTIERDLAKYYRDSLKNIRTNIEALYGRFARDNKLSPSDARKLITGSEYRQWRMDIKEYLQKIKDTGNEGLQRELNTLAMRSRISRLDKLYGETVKELDGLGRHITKSMTSFLSDSFKDNYYHRLYDIGKINKILPSISKVDNKTMADILHNRWSGKNYSERIWKNTSDLAKNVRQEVLTSVHRGESVQKISARLAKRESVELYKATRLVRTELNYVNNTAAFDSIKDSGMKKFRFIATLDRRTSTICREHDGRVYSVDEAKSGNNIPPLHPNCRSTIAGMLDDEDTESIGTRIARAGTGKTYHVPAGMKYDDWKAVYIDKSKSLADWRKSAKIQIMNDNINAEDQRYGRNKNTVVNKTYIESGEYRRKFDTITANPIVNKVLYDKAKKTLKHRSGTLFEDMYWIDGDTGEVVAKILNSQYPERIKYPQAIRQKIKQYSTLITLHNHPGSMPPSSSDFTSANANNYKLSLIIGHNGAVFCYQSKSEISSKLNELYIAEYIDLGYNEYEAQMKALQKLQRGHDIEFWEVISNE